MGQKMKNAPVYFTIAQVKFNPVLTLPSLIPSIQEFLRKRNYPDFKKSATITFNLMMNADSDNSAPVPQAIEQFSFSNVDNTEIFTLDQGSLAFQVTSYEHFEKFSKQLIEILDLVHRTVGGLSYVERIGVRYLDAVRPTEGEELSQYLIPQVLGLYSRLEGQIHHAFSESQITDDNGSLTARTVIQQGRIGFPPDLQACGLSIVKPFSEFLGLHAILDTDASYLQRLPFDLDAVANRLFLLHDKTSVAFRSSVTEHALSKWA
jgi:uncharacterized protein (TIGR04255 family)